MHSLRNYKNFKIFIKALIVPFVVVSAGCHHHDESDHHDEEEEEHIHEGAVIIEPEKASEFGIETENVKETTFSEIIKTGGQIEPSPTDVMTVTAHKSGIFHLSPSISPGMIISQGALIGTITSAGMEGGDATAAAHANMEAARKELERLTPLFHEGLVTASVYNEAERRYKESQALASHAPKGGSVSETAPCSGTLSQIPVVSGQFVDAGTPLAIITKSSRLTLRADVPSRYLSSLPTVTTANFRPENSDSSFSIASLGGTLVSQGNYAASSSGFIPLYFSFEGNGTTLPGAYAEVFLVGTPRENVLTLPISSLVELQGNKYVYEVHDGHAYEKKLVKTGVSDGKRIEILEGVTPGETIVTKGASVVRMAETSAIAPPGHTHNH